MARHHQFRTEQDLMQACLAHDALAWQKLDEQYRQSLKGYVAKLLRSQGIDPAEAEDVVQELFIELYRHSERHLKPFDSAKGSLLSWLVRAARQQTQAFLRRTGRHAGHHVRLAENHPLDATASDVCLEAQLHEFS